MENKACNICKIEKPISEFFKEAGVGQKSTKSCASCRAKAAAHYYAKHEEKKAYGRAYRAANKEYYSNALKQWKSENKDAFYEHDRERYSKDSRYKAITLEQVRPRAFVRAKKGGKKAVAALGCSRADFIKHIESQFHSGMSWENYGCLWAFDHIFPLSVAYDMGPEAFKQATHYTNVQPILSRKNGEKGFSLPENHPLTQLYLGFY